MFLRFSSFEIFSKITRLKLHIEPKWGWEIKVCLWDLRHKMTIMPIYGKKNLKFFSEIQ